MKTVRKAFFVSDSQLEIIKKYLVKLEGKATNKSIKELIESRIFLHGQIGFDNAVIKMQEFIDLVKVC